VALFCLVALRIPNALICILPILDNLAVAGELIYFSFCNSHVGGLWRHHPLESNSRAASGTKSSLRRSHPQGREAGRPAGTAGDEGRAFHQPQDRKGGA
jgi:hypothetical protein